MKDQGIKNISDLEQDVQRLGSEQILTVVYVALEENGIGFITLRDPIKASTPKAIEELHQMGLKVIMLSGDNLLTVKELAKKLKIDAAYGGVEPLQKQAFIMELRKNGHLVAMAGDGINDSPALASADVGVAMGTGTDVAIESASVTLVKGDLMGIARAIHLSRAVMKNIRQNLFLAFIYNVLAIPIAAGILFPFFGLLLNPMIAAFAMSLSSISVILNALRLNSQKIS